MAGPNGGVWGNEVTVPPGEKLTQNTASYVQPAGGAEGAENAEGAEGAENAGGDDANNPTEPVVKMPDGTEVPVADYDPYAQQRQELEQRESRVDGMMSVINGNGNGNNGEGTGESSNTGTGDQTEEVHPLLAENPLLQKVEIDDEFASDEDKANAQRYNNLVDYTQQQNQIAVDRENALMKEIGAIRDEVGDRFVREDIAQATALTGVTEAEMVAASRATGVTDVKTLATIVAGEKAIQAQQEETAAAAEAQREKEAGNITSTSQGTGGNQGTQQKEGRGVENWRDKESVGAAYKFGSVS